MTVVKEMQTQGETEKQTEEYNKYKKKYSSHDE